MAEVREIRQGQHWLARLDGVADVETSAGVARGAGQQ
jgi:hypothetical protein